MRSPTRRRLLLAGGASLAWLSGCLDSVAINDDASLTADENGTDSTTYTTTDDSADGRTEQTDTPRDTDESIPCSVAGEIVEDVPADAPVVSASTANVSETTVLKRLFAAAHSEDADRTTARRRSGEYEKVSVTPDSTATLEAARDELQRHPLYDDPDYPVGVYIDDGDLVLAVYTVCLTG